MTTNVRLGLLLIVAATIILSDRLLYLLWRIIRFQRLRPELQVETMPVLRWFRRRRELQVDPTEIRDFVVNLELATSLEQTLAGALVETAEQFADRGVFGQRLKRHVATRLVLSPEDVIRGLLEDFGSSDLRDLLTRLELYGNQISDVSALSGLEKLSVLQLFRNTISDITPLVENKGLSAGDEVDLEGNPLNDEAYKVHFPALAERGVKVNPRS